MTDTKHPTVGSFLFDYIHSKGVTHAFGIPGDFVLPTFRWLEKSPIDIITMTHEPSVGFAADGYARMHGLGLACVTYCVGGLNMLNSVACAYAEKSPMIVVSGGPSPSDRQADPLLHHKVRTFDTQRRIFEEVTCANTVLLDPEHAAEEIMRVVDTVIAQCRPGYIEVPFDVVDMPITLPRIRNNPLPSSDAENLEACIEDAIEVISKAKQPVIIADVELHRHGLTDLAVTVAEKLNIPIASTLLSKSVISEHNPLYIGVYSGGFSEQDVQDYVEGSDCLIMLGAFITDILLGLNTAKLNKRNTVLVTTEKARVGLRSYEDVLFKDFLEALAVADVTPHPDRNTPSPAPTPKPLSDDEREEPLTVEQFFRILGLHIGEDNTLVCDTGDALLGAIGLRTPKRNNFLSDAYYLSMGFAMPAAIGAMAASPESRVFTIIGDGAFQMTGIELSTAAKYNMKPIVFILNNDGYGTQRHILDGPFNNIHMWDYTKMTDLLRCGKSARVATRGALEDILKEAVETDEMYVIEVTIPRDDSSRSLRRLGEELGKLRDAEKRT
ncbi:MAG: preprotein translocase subunit Tim44 [Rickettsiales bacterium]|nr:preprotein translocase subunit Tim44 [Rickettsiales bacterium]